MLLREHGMEVIMHYLYSAIIIIGICGFLTATGAIVYIIVDDVIKKEL